jgi:O-antigen/teichoic acid export membrane protein
MTVPDGGGILRTGSAARGFMAATLSASTGLLSTLIIVPVALARLGADSYGDWAILWQVIGYVGFLDLGIAYAASRDIAAARARGETDGSRFLVASGFWLYAALGVAFFLAGLFLLPLLSALLGEGNSLMTPWLALLVFGTSAFPSRFLAAANQGAQRIAAANVIGLVQGLVNIVLSLLLLWLGLGLLGLALGVLLSGLLALALQMMVFARVYGFAALAPSLVRRSSIRGLVGFSLQVFVTGLSWTVVASTDTLVIGAVLGSAAAAFFVVNYRLPSQLVAFLNLGADAALPGLAALTSDSSRVKSANRWLSVLVGLASGLCAAGVAVFLKPFVHIWIGKGYVPSTLLLVLISYLVVHHPIQHLLATFLTAARSIGAFAVVSTIEAVLNVFLSIAFTSRLGIPGVLLGTAIAGILNVGYLSIRMGRLVGRSAISLLVQLYLPALIAVSFGLVVGVPLIQLLDPANWPTLAVTGCGWLLGVLTMLALSDRFLWGSKFRRFLVDLSRATLGQQSPGERHIS